MRTYFIGHIDCITDGRIVKYETDVQHETDSLKAAKKWATRNRYYAGRLVVPEIYIRLFDGRVELAAVGEYNRHTGRTKWTEVY